MLSKHPGRCRFPHGHSRRIDLVLASDSLDAGDMVVDFKALKLAVADYLDSYDHAMCINSADPSAERMRASGERVVVFEDEDPTTEAMARRIYEFLSGELARGRSYADAEGSTYRLRPGVTLERVRVGETSTSWAEYGVE